MIRYIFIFLLFLSCNGVQKNDSTTNSNPKSTLKDTVITYNLEGISTEGTSANVLYQNGKILESIINLYSGTGKKEIEYLFEKDRIKVVEKYFIYLTELENVKSDDDIELTKEQTYYINYSGNVIGNPVEDRIDIFSEFKKEIPFTIK